MNSNNKTIQIQNEQKDDLNKQVENKMKWLRNYN